MTFDERCPGRTDWSLSHPPWIQTLRGYWWAMDLPPNLLATVCHHSQLQLLLSSIIATWVQLLVHAAVSGFFHLTKLLEYCSQTTQTSRGCQTDARASIDKSCSRLSQPPCMLRYVTCSWVDRTPTTQRAEYTLWKGTVSFRNIGMSIENLWSIASQWTLFCFFLVLCIFTATRVTYSRGGENDSDHENIIVYLMHLTRIFLE